MQRGDRAPVIVSQVTFDLQPGASGLCRLFGTVRQGGASVVAGFHSGVAVTNTQCDPLGTNPTGNQLYAMRPDGSGLRQITHARGMTIDTPELVEVELPGPFAYR